MHTPSNLIDSQRKDSGSSSAGSEAADTGSPQKKRGMILPFDQHSVTFENVIYSVDIPKVT